MTRRHLATLPIVAAVLAAAVACTGSPETSKQDSPAVTAGCSPGNANPSAPVDDTDLNVVADEIHPKAQADFKDVYAGVEVVSEASRVRVYRKPSGPFDDWIRKTYAERCVELANAKHSAAELATLTEKVEGDIGYWAELGINITGTAAKQDGSALVVGVEGAVVDRAKQELPAKYGTEIPIIIEESGPA
jgi:hypothetical protein